MVGIFFFFFSSSTLADVPVWFWLRLWEFESPLSSWHAYRLQKNTWPGKNRQRGWGYTMCWQQRSPKKLISLPFPSPSFSPLCRSSLHLSFLFRPIPCGAMMQVRPLLSPRLKITPPKPTRRLKVVYLHQKTLSSFSTALCAERDRKLCQVPLSQAVKTTYDWWSTKLKPHRFTIHPCCRALETQTRRKYQSQELLSGFAVAWTKILVITGASF